MKSVGILWPDGYSTIRREPRPPIAKARHSAGAIGGDLTQTMQNSALHCRREAGGAKLAIGLGSA